MKDYKPNAIRYSVIVLSTIIVSAFTLFGCVVVTTSKVADTNRIEGMVYHLPASFLKVSFESKKDTKGNHSELIVAVVPEIVPDKKMRFMLKPEDNDLFTRNHTFTFTNGLLSTVATEDEGKSGEIITNIASIAMNVIKVGALPKTAFVRSTQYPSNEEIVDALSSIAPGRHDFLFALTNRSAEETYLPGTAELLGFSWEIKGLPDNSQNDKQDNSQINNNSEDTIYGIATRVLEPYSVEISLNLKLKVLYDNRIADFDNQIADFEQTIKQTEKTIKEFKVELNKVQNVPTKEVDLKEKIAKFEKTLKDSELSLEKAKKGKADNEGFLKKPYAKEGYKIANHSSLILIPDYSPTVKIPLKRSLLGKTKFSLTLNQGILTDYHAEHPSTTLEIVKVPLNISEAIVKLPAEILQLKIDYSSKAQALLEQQTKYQEALKALAEKKNIPSSYTEQEKALEQEKAILQLQKEIAELKAAILKLESQ